MPGLASSTIMRVLLVQNAVYAPSHGGANKANRLICELLARRGHECHVIATAGGAQATTGGDPDLLRSAGAEIEAAGPEGLRFRLRGVSVQAVANPGRLRAELAELLGSLKPDAVLVSSEDAFQSLLRVAIQTGAERVVYLAYTTLVLPFGPGSVFPNPSAAELLRCVGGIVPVSRFIHDYLRRWGDLESEMVRLPIYGAGPYRDLGRFDAGALLMVNPCAVKGLPVFLALADAFPELPFAAVRSWGTNQSDLEALRARPNVEVLDPVDDIDAVFERARAVVMPSLWQEAFGFVAVEAMLRGLPVLASDVGGLPEAKLGVEYVLPVRPIERYASSFDDRMMPRAVIPEQDPAPWIAAVRELLGSRERYEDVSARSRAAAHAFVEGCSIEPLEELLRRLSH